MKKLDLHKVSHENAKKIVEDFIISNFMDLPIEIITGNSLDMQNIVKKIVHKHKLRVVPSHPNNLGSYIINNRLRDGGRTFKVGKTIDLDERMKRINRTDASFGKFEVVDQFSVSDISAAEAKCHEILAKYRIQEQREFFKGKKSDIINTVKDITSEYKPEFEISEYSPTYLDRIGVTCPHCEALTKNIFLDPPKRVVCGDCKLVKGLYRK